MKRATTWLVGMALVVTGVLALPGCRKKGPGAAVKPVRLYVDLTGTIDAQGEFHIQNYRIGATPIDAMDTVALRKAIRQKRTQTPDRPVVVDILAPGIARFHDIAPILDAAGSENVRQVDLAVLLGDLTKPLAKRPQGLALLLTDPTRTADLLSLGKAEAVMLKIHPAAKSDTGFELAAAVVSAADPNGLEDALAARRKQLGAGRPAILRPEPEASCEQIAKALSAAHGAGFAEVFFGQTFLPGQSGPAVALPPAATAEMLTIDPKAPQPETSFAGAKGKGYNVVYLVDRSGSMLDVWTGIRRALTASIEALQPTQYFHVILFGGRRPIEFSSRQLIPASRSNKQAVLAWLDTIPCQGATQPIPAIERAFDVLDRAKKDHPGKTVFLMTDGDFSAEDRYTDNAGVLKIFTDRDADKNVQVNTLLVGKRTPTGEKLLKEVAEQRGGSFTFVGTEE